MRVTHIFGMAAYIIYFGYCFQAYAGIEAGLWEFGTTITTSCMWAMLGQVALETRAWVCIWLTYLYIAFVSEVNI